MHVQRLFFLIGEFWLGRLVDMNKSVVCNYLRAAFQCTRCCRLLPLFWFITLHVLLGHTILHYTNLNDSFCISCFLSGFSLSDAILFSSSCSSFLFSEKPSKCKQSRPMRSDLNNWVCVSKYLLENGQKVGTWDRKPKRKLGQFFPTQSFLFPTSIL